MRPGARDLAQWPKCQPGKREVRSSIPKKKEKAQIKVAKILSRKPQLKITSVVFFWLSSHWTNPVWSNFNFQSLLAIVWIWIGCLPKVRVWEVWSSDWQNWEVNLYNVRPLERSLGSTVDVDSKSIEVSSETWLILKRGLLSKAEPVSTQLSLASYLNCDPSFTCLPVFAIFCAVRQLKMSSPELNRYRYRTLKFQNCELNAPLYFEVISPISL